MIKDQVKQFRDERGEVFAELKYNHESFGNFAKHSHATLNIVAIGSGSIEIDYHAQPPQHLLPCQLAIFNPLQVHMTTNQTSDSLEYHSLHLDPDWSLGIQRDIFGDLDNLLPVVPNIILDSSKHEKFMQVFNMMLTGDGQTIRPHLDSFMTDIFESYCTNDTTDICSKQNSTLLEEIMSYIIQNIDDNPTIDEIASSAGLTSAHINRIFKKEFGLTLHAFLVDKKLHKAKRLMLDSKQLTLADISYEAGFYDQSHFIKVFKKAYSLTPNLFKRG